MRQNRHSTKMYVVHHNTLSDSFRILIVWFQPKQDSDRIRISYLKNRIGSDRKNSLSDHLWPSPKPCKKCESDSKMDDVESRWANPKRTCEAEMSRGQDCIGLDQDWSQFLPDQDWIGLQFFLKIGGSGLDRTEKILVVLMWLFWKYQKF